MSASCAPPSPPRDAGRARRPRPRPARGDRRRLRRPRPRRARSPSSRPPAAPRCPTAPRSIDGAGPPPAAGLRRPARAPARARPGAQGGPRDRHARRRRRRLLRGGGDAQHRPGGRQRARSCASLRDAAARDARVPVGFMASITTGLRGEELTEMAELRDEGALGFTDDGKPVISAGMLRKALQYQRLAGGAARAARGGPRAQRPRRHARGRGQRAARRGRHPERERVDHGRPRLRAGRLRGRPHPHPAPVVHRVRRGGRGGQGRPACRSPARPRPHHLCLTERGGPRPRHADEDEPAAAHRGRPPGAGRGPARRA